jgi:hypothetical protein
MYKKVDKENTFHPLYIGEIRTLNHSLFKILETFKQSITTIKAVNDVLMVFRRLQKLRF